MDISAKAIKKRVGGALKAAGISLRQLAIDEGLDRNAVRGWVNTDRTMPVEFAALVAERTGESGHYLLTGQRVTKQEARYGLMERVLAGDMDKHIAGEVGSKGRRKTKRIPRKGSMTAAQRREAKRRKNGE